MSELNEALHKDFTQLFNKANVYSVFVHNCFAVLLLLSNPCESTNVAVEVLYANFSFQITAVLKHCIYTHTH